ncbi:hypothetical protein ASL14_22595 [Paenibacillus sp. IHB B 3084]|uniref:DUF2188 domain-containing protein n=1 Tax=Paenibacillus sp. IHB B 3084 TaxID=867076 RepID=UPI000720D4D8|nr:DUF2188 domain-containing protein [Paenibacillus sp. IHB B 3084]ALP38551.1 hypothetical protein ASL14_22595 [Paenibacillus sp. IHB B 3084]
MPWTKHDYPPSMKNLEPRVREKAVDIANALLRDGYEEGRSIAIATSQAEEWDDNHPTERDGKQKKHEQQHSSRNGKNKLSASSEPQEPIHVVPHEYGWAIKEEGHDKPASTFRHKNETVNEAQKLVNRQQISAIIHDQNGRIHSTLKPSC